MLPEWMAVVHLCFLGWMQVGMYRAAAIQGTNLSKAGPCDFVLLFVNCSF